MKKEIEEIKDLTEKAAKKELRGYYYAGVHQYEGECDEDRFIAIVFCDQYGVSYESYYDGWDYIIKEVPDYEEVRDMESMIERLQEQLADASKTIDYYDKKDFHYTLADGTVMGAEPAHKYKVKWGVK